MGLNELRFGDGGEIVEYDRVAVAIERLQFFEHLALEYSERGYYVADSGGKDSSVIKQLCIEAGVRHEIVHSHTTADHPETVRFVRRERARYEEMGIPYGIEYPMYKGKRTSMWQLIVDKGLPPTRLMRYCCDVIKEGGGADRVTVTGVRRAESVNRSRRGVAEHLGKSKADAVILNNDNTEARREFERCPTKGKLVVNPIIDWSDSDVWEYIRARGIVYNPLYDAGYKRVGCVGCPCSVNAAAELDKLPKFKQMYIHAFDRMLVRRAGKYRLNWATGAAVYEWWTGRVAANDNAEQLRFDYEEDEEDEEEQT